MQKKVTITEIAREAGVTKAVVSTILNKKEGGNIRVGEKKKVEILDLIERYGYVPRKSARDLASQKTNTIGLIFHQLTPYFSSLLEEVQEQASKKGLEVMPYITKGYADKEEGYLNLMRDGRVDAILTAAFTEGSPARYIKFSSSPYNLKIVTINPPIGNIPSVHFDEEEAGMIAAQHLVEIGCKNLCVFGGYGESGREKGFISHIRNTGATSPSIFSVGENPTALFEDGVILARRLLHQKTFSDGVFAYNDLVAAGLLSEVHNAGIKVPDEMAIVSCDNTETCLSVHPPLTSIDTDVSLTAQTALEKLMNLINGKSAKPLHTTVPVKLVIRDSTKRS